MTEKSNKQSLFSSITKEIVSESSVAMVIQCKTSISQEFLSESRMERNLSESKRAAVRPVQMLWQHLISTCVHNDVFMLSSKMWPKMKAFPVEIANRRWENVHNEIIKRNLTNNDKANKLAYVVHMKQGKICPTDIQQSETDIQQSVLHLFIPLL